MEFQIITAMLVTLFFLLYREHRIGQKKIAETFKAEMDRLHNEIKALEPGPGRADEATRPVSQKAEKVDTKLSSVPR
jgi:hypothetical protein